MNESYERLIDAVYRLADRSGDSHDKCAAAIFRFAESLHPEEVIEAVAIAVDKFPDRGQHVFRYFCGVCHGKIRDAKFRRWWRDRDG